MTTGIPELCVDDKNSHGLADDAACLADLEITDSPERLSATDFCAVDASGDMEAMAWLDHYTKNTHKAMMKLCDEAWTWPALSEMTCERLGTTVGPNFSSLGGIILHEIM